VQGVGFRPHIARIASGYPLSGFCGNDDASVFFEIQGPSSILSDFYTELIDTLPPLASVVSSSAIDLEVQSDETGFIIVESVRKSGPASLIPPDLAPCDDCLRELKDSGDRRLGYPFISCVNCGPRLSVIRELPYDRCNTTLDVFPLCEECTQEYENPLDRRFHAEPISCFSCGPLLELISLDGQSFRWNDAISETQRIISEGGIVAVKGIGGFTLMCDAYDERAVAKLRKRKMRPAKPFAVMAADYETASTVAIFSSHQRAELISQQRPIILVPRQHSFRLADSVAPGLKDIGVMLPSAPLHHLLLKTGDVWVSTSGNISGNPLTYRNEDALEQLSGIADAWLLNDRVIHVPVEDSVLSARTEESIPIRRSRGYAPLPIPTPGADETVLAVGAELKNTFALTRDGMTFVSTHVGDMGSLMTQQAFERGVEQMLSAHRKKPQLVVADLHPSYSTTAWAQKYSWENDIPLIQVQHHHAHALSLLAEHEIHNQNAYCVVLDGTGYGLDGTIWGGEILLLDANEMERVWHLPTFALAGGDSAVSNPWKCALALLSSLGIDATQLPPWSFAPPQERELVISQLQHSVAVVQTSSAGRLFDAVASILGVCHRVSYEAQAAMELEAHASMCRHDSHEFPVASDISEVVTILVELLISGADTTCIARYFHLELAAVLSRVIEAVVPEGELVGLTGGVFQNKIFSQALNTQLRKTSCGYRVIEHNLVPTNDGGISLGQARAGISYLLQEGDTECV